MDKTTRVKIVEKCGRCEAGGIEDGEPQCFHMYHRGPKGGWGTDWVLNCPEFKDTGTVGVIKRTCIVERR